MFGRSTMTREAILDAITRLESEKRNGNSRNGESSKNSLLSRCRELQNGAVDVMFNPSEVREILTLVLEQVRYQGNSEAQVVEGTDDEERNDDNAVGYCDEEGGQSQPEELTIEERPWAAGEIAELIQVLSDAA